MKTPKKTPKKITVNIKNYNNKTRKGDYIYIKAPQKPPRTYKIKGTPQEIDAIITHYKNKYIQQKKLNQPTLTQIKKAFQPNQKTTRLQKHTNPPIRNIHTNRHNNDIQKSTMIKLKSKHEDPIDYNEGIIEGTPTPENTETKLELLKDIGEVHQHTVKTDITSDYVLAKLDEVDREAIS